MKNLQEIKSKILNKELRNSIVGNQLLNSGGAFGPTDLEYQYAIDTLSYIRTEIIKQTFYEVAPADFIPVDVGEAAYASEIVSNLEFAIGGDFFAGDTSANGNMGKISNVNVGLTPLRIPTQFWIKGVLWNIIEIKQAAQYKRWDVVAARMESLKKDWDLGIQEVAFLGHPRITTMPGLINNSDLTPNTTLITTPISEMSTAEFKAFVAGILKAYWAYSNNTVLPDTFVLPMNDYLGLGDFVSDLDVRMSKIEYLTKLFTQMTGNANFKIQGLAYCQSEINASRGIEKNRYVLYRKDPKTLKMGIPVDFTMFAPNTADETQWAQRAMGQYSGVLMTKPLEVLYLDETASVTT